MSDFKSRLIKEEGEMTDKIMKLHDFIQSTAFEEIESIQKSLLKIQFKAMLTYNECLRERLSQLG